VRTESAAINQVRRYAIELLIANHPADCLTCAKNQNCELQRVAAYLGVDPQRMGRLRPMRQELPIDDSNPFFIRDLNKCILCAKCVRACADVQGNYAIDIAYRGFPSEVSTFGNRPIFESICESCGECVVRCPTGALVPKNFRVPAREVKTVCPYCGVGCSIYLGVRGDEVVSVRGDRESPVNRGRLCVKGRFGSFEFINHPDRLRSPLIKRDGQFVEATWDEALDLVARRFAESRAEAFAAVSSAKATNEENYLVQKLARAVLGSNNVDHCARL
jgi:predicted molibdopterin-dependent oxidoreductase YjgC